MRALLKSYAHDGIACNLFHTYKLCKWILSQNNLGIVWSLFQIFKVCWFSSKSEIYFAQKMKDRISVVLVCSWILWGGWCNGMYCKEIGMCCFHYNTMIWTFWHSSFLDFIKYFFETHQLLLLRGPLALLFCVLRYYSVNFLLINFLKSVSSFNCHFITLK